MTDGLQQSLSCRWRGQCRRWGINGALEWEGLSRLWRWLAMQASGAAAVAVDAPVAARTAPKVKSAESPLMPNKSLTALGP